MTTNKRTPYDGFDKDSGGGHAVGTGHVCLVTVFFGILPVDTHHQQLVPEVLTDFRLRILIHHPFFTRIRKVDGTGSEGGLWGLKIPALLPLMFLDVLILLN